MNLMNIFNFFCLFFVAVIAIPLQTPAKKQTLATVDNGIPSSIHGISSKQDLSSKQAITGDLYKHPTSQTRCTPRLMKRDPVGPVETAVKSPSNSYVTGGYSRKIWLGKFNSQEAIIKIVTDDDVDISKIEKEVRNLKAVNHLFGWGHDAARKRFYIVMHFLGINTKKAQKKHPIHNPTPLTTNKSMLHELRNEAKERYKRLYHMANNDTQDDNFVWHLVNGKWVAEIVDWEDAQPLDGKVIPPVDPPEIFEYESC